MSLTLYTYPGNPNAFKALISAEYVGVNIDVPPFQMGKDNKTEAFLKKNPNGKVPTLDTPEGPVFESNAIARYVARLRPDVGLYGRTFMESAQVDTWIDWCQNELAVPLSMWLYPVLGFMPNNPKAVGKAKQDVKAALTILENHLLHRTFVVGERVTLADVVLASHLLYPLKFLMDAAYRKPFPCVVRWFKTCVNQPQFRAVVGEVPLCEQEVEAPKSSSKKPKKEKKAAQPKKEKKEKKEEAPAAAAAAPAAGGSQKKPPHPLSLLPKSPFNLDEFLRTYSNSKDDFYASMPYFWEHYDPEGWSLWFCDYNYNSENKIAFMTSNLVGGFVQRCDELRKYAFGVMAVLHDEAEGHYKVRGCWLMRGHDLKCMMEYNPDAEYYTWTRVEDLNEQNKKNIADYWCAEEQVDGFPLVDSKVFK